jgi:hypothetical protein
LDKQIKD